MISIIINLDHAILFAIQSIHNPIFDVLMMASSYLGEWGLIWIAISLFLLFNKKTRIIGIMTLSALILSTIAGEGILKHLIQRPRPYSDFADVKLLIRESSIYSFPSGHTASSFSAAFILGKYIKKYSLVFWALAILIAFSRLYLFMHYLTDILAGVIVGLACGIIIDLSFKIKFKEGLS